MSGYNSPVIYRNAAAFLTSVLQSQKSVIAGKCRCQAVISVNSEYAAFLMQLLRKIIL